MVKQEQEKSLTAPLTLPTASGRKARKASRTGNAGRLNIVRAQIRLPNDIEEDCSSGGGGSSAAMSGQSGGGKESVAKQHTGEITASDTKISDYDGNKVGYDSGGGNAAAGGGLTSASSGRVQSGPTKSVASMVRR